MIVIMYGRRQSGCCGHWIYHAPWLHAWAAPLLCDTASSTWFMIERAGTIAGLVLRTWCLYKRKRLLSGISFLTAWTTIGCFSNLCFLSVVYTSKLNVISFYIDMCDLIVLRVSRFRLSYAFYFILSRALILQAGIWNHRLVWCNIINFIYI